MTSACKRPKAVPDPADAKLTSTASASRSAPIPAPSASSSASGAEIVPPVFPTPPTPPGANALEVEIATAICKAARMKTTIGCVSHPPFVTAAQMPDGKLDEFQGPDPLTFCSIDKLYPGSFTKKGARQVLVAFSQCKDNDPDATWDMGFPGSGVLVEKVDGAHWRSVGYVPDVNLPRCKPSHRSADDRDVLFCESSFSAGAGTMSYFTEVDLTRTPHATTLARIFDDEVNCMMMEGDGSFHLEGGFTIAEVSDFSVTDLNGDGTGDLVIAAKRAHLPPSASLDAKIKSMCKRPGATNMPGSPLPKSALKSARLEIVSSGASFAPTPATKKLLDDWQAEANTGVALLIGASPPSP